MTDAEFRDWLDREVKESRMTAGQRSDLLEQKQLFDADLPADDTSKRSDYRGWIVGYVAGERRQERAIHALLTVARRDHPGSMIYFEPIGFDLF